MFNVNSVLQITISNMKLLMESYKTHVHLSLKTLRFDKLFRSKLHAWNSLSSKKPQSCLEQR